MLSLQIATANGPIVPVLACVEGQQETSVPAALPVDITLPVDRLIARLNSALRVRALHATVLRRIENFAAQDGPAPPLPANDALEDATVLIVGRGPTLSVAQCCDRRARPHGRCAEHGDGHQASQRPRY
jgi:hypothetical protein